MASNWRGYASSVALVAMLVVIGAAGDDDACKRLKGLDYFLYGTKTTYSEAQKVLKKNDDLPKSFGDDSIEKEHEDLLDDHCRPVVFYFIGRHSARFPDSEDIEEYNKRLYALQDKIKQLDAVKRCPEKFRDILSWRSKMQPKHDNVITELGAKEQRGIAQRFKALYPEFFNTEKADVKIGVTSKLRTAQTGAEFLRAVDGLRLPSCEGGSLPTNDLSNPNYDLDKILTSICYKSMIQKYELPFLESHDSCEKLKGKSKTKDPTVERVKNAEALKEISERVSKKLGIAKGSPNYPIDDDTLDSIFSMCRFEKALDNNSIWCSLFEKKDVKAFEFVQDVDDYIKDAHGPNAQAKQVCPLVKDLIQAMNDGLKLTGESNEKRKAYMMFSHAGLMKKLMASLGLFRDDKDFSERHIREFLSSLKSDKDREWRSSLITPFSGNMAFIMYRCQKPGKSVKNKILATVNERPVKLAGCEKTQCKAAKFFENLDAMKDCDLSKICR